MYNLNELYFKKNNYVDESLCDEYIKYFEDNYDGGSEASYNIKKDAVEKIKSKVFDIRFDTNLYEKSLKITETIIEDYYNYLIKFNAFDIKTFIKQLKHIHSFRILKYEKGDYIHLHVDKMDHTYASFSIGLNSIDEYDGGEFCLFNSKECFKLKKGSVLIFPASYFWTHETKPITSGVRYVMNCFLTNVSNAHVSLLSNMPDNNIFKQPIVNEKFL